MRSLKNERGYKQPNPEDNVRKQFWDCCSKVYEKYPEKIEEAIRNFPTYKIAEKFNFELCKGTVRFYFHMGREGPNATLNYEFCR